MTNTKLHDYTDALLEDLDPKSDDYSAITESIQAQAGLLVAEWRGIKRILTKDDQVGVSFGINFVQAGKRIKGEVKMAYAEKFKNSAEFITPDFDQTELFGKEQPDENKPVDYREPSRFGNIVITNKTAETVDKIFAAEKRAGEPPTAKELFKKLGEIGKDFFPPLDEKSREALEVIRKSKGASARILKRRMTIGSMKAASIIADFEARGWIGPANGQKPREILNLPEKEAV